MSNKHLYECSVNIRMHVMAESNTEARKLARRSLDMDLASITEDDFMVYGVIMGGDEVIEKDDLETQPYGLEPGDTRTVGDILGGK